MTDPEPLPAESELWSLPNVILTPHASWATEHLMERAAEIFVDNFDRYLRGDQLRNRRRHGRGVLNAPPAGFGHLPGEAGRTLF